MARRSTEIEQLAADRRRVFKKYGVILAEDVDSPNHNVPTSVLFDMLGQVKQTSTAATLEFYGCLFDIEKWCIQHNYQGVICMYPYRQLL